jgi:hypothetical protein
MDEDTMELQTYRTKNVKETMVVTSWLILENVKKKKKIQGHNL